MPVVDRLYYFKSSVTKFDLYEVQSLSFSFQINHSNVHWQIRVLHEVFWASVAPSTQREIILQGFANESLFNTKLTAFCVYMSGFLTICRPIVKMHLNSYREKLLIQKNWLDMLSNI